MHFRKFLLSSHWHSFSLFLSLFLFFFFLFLIFFSTPHANKPSLTLLPLLSLLNIPHSPLPLKHSPTLLSLSNIPSSQISPPPQGVTAKKKKKEKNTFPPPTTKHPQYHLKSTPFLSRNIILFFLPSFSMFCSCSHINVCFAYNRRPFNWCLPSC